MIYKSILKREMIVQGTTTFVIKIWALVFGVEFLFHLIGFTYIAWVGSICHVDTFVRCRVFSQKEQVDAQCVLQKTKLVDQRPVVAGNFFSGIRGGPSRFQGALRVCTVPTGWVPLCTDHCALLVCVHSGLCTELVADTQCCSSLQNQIQFNLSQFCWFTQDSSRSSFSLESQNTILLSALLWLSYGESTVSLRCSKSNTGRHKHSLGGSTTGFIPGPGSGSPSHLGPFFGSQKFLDPESKSSLKVLLLLWQMVVVEGPGEPLVMLGWVGRWTRVAVLLHLRSRCLCRLSLLLLLVQLLDRLDLLLQLHPPVLEPNFDLSLSETELVSHLDPASPREVVIRVKFLFQLKRLVSGVSLSAPPSQSVGPGK